MKALRWFFYAAVLVVIVFGPSWWSGFFAGVGLAVAALDFGTWESTRRHRAETRPWKEQGDTTLSTAMGIYNQDEGGRGEL